MNAKNKDLPAYPIKFVDQFNQTVVLGGMTKQELVSIEILKNSKNILSFRSDYEIKELIEKAYKIGEFFCNYQEEKSKKTINQSKIIS